MGVIYSSQGQTSALSGITITPPLTEVSLSPGLVDTKVFIEVTNNTSSRVSANLKLIDLKALGASGGSTLDVSGLSDRYGLVNWMSLPEGDSVEIQQSKTVKIPIKIYNHPDLAPGGHYGAVVISTDTKDKSKTGAVDVGQQLIPLVFVKKVGGEKYGLELTSIEVNTKNGLATSVNAKFKASGNVHVTPRGYVEVINPGGKQVAKGVLNSDSLIVMPENSRVLETSIKYFNKANLPGRYKIISYYRYDGAEKFNTRTDHFLYTGSVAFKIAVVASLGSIFGLGYWITRKLRHKRSKRR